MMIKFVDKFTKKWLSGNQIYISKFASFVYFLYHGYYRLKLSIVGTFKLLKNYS